MAFQFRDKDVVQGRGQQRIHSPLPRIVIYFRQLSSEKFSVYYAFGWHDFVMKATHLYQQQNVCPEARLHHTFCICRIDPNLVKEEEIMP